MWGKPTIGISNLDFEIQNVVACADLNQKIDLPDIMKFFVNVKYEPRRFPGLVFRLNRPKTATLIFRTGKMVCTGAKSEKLAKRAVRKVVRKLREEGFIIMGKPDITIENVVSTANLGGNMTPIGSPSTIIAIGISDQEGYPIPFTTFLKMGVGLTVVHFVISMIYLYIKYGILSM